MEGYILQWMAADLSIRLCLTVWKLASSTDVHAYFLKIRSLMQNDFNRCKQNRLSECLSVSVL